VQLLDNKVLDPRLLQKLLRHQAAMLLLRCFTRPLLAFRFDPGQRPPALHERLALDISVVALLVEACLLADAGENAAYDEQHEFSRRAIRGQNLDRAGLSAQHQKILSQVSEGTSLTTLTEQTQVEREELRRVLWALTLADLVEAKAVETGRKVVVLETDPQLTLQLREAAAARDCPLALRVVRDRLSLQLLLKRQHPDVLVIALDSDVGQQVAHELAQHDDVRVWVGIVSHDGQAASVRERIAAQLQRPYSPSELFEAIEQAWTRRHDAACVGA
jgi:hypothetical protein